jgi:hypothetical protein
LVWVLVFYWAFYGVYSINEEHSPVKASWISTILILLVTTSALFPSAKSQAASGLPDTLEFGIGARLDLEGLHQQTAINAAAGIGMDWLGVTFDWGQIWKDPQEAPDLTSINQMMASAGQANLNVMLSIENAPPWANGANGPDPDITANLVTSLSRLYPGTLLAVELFPSANTSKGWGAPPDPSAYLVLLQKSYSALEEAGSGVVLVTGGLTPLAPEQQESDMDDLDFLDALYKNGAAPYMPIISLRLENITGDPMYSPATGERRFLRHYEEIRRLMLQYQHQEGLIWITGFSWPRIAIEPSDIIYMKVEEQTAWLNKAYKLMRAQLYIGAVFFSQLNPPKGGTNGLHASLILNDGSLHPGCESLAKLIIMNGAMKTAVFRGNISKKTPLKLEIKPSQP